MFELEHLGFRLQLPRSAFVLPFPFQGTLTIRPPRPRSSPSLLLSFSPVPPQPGTYYCNHLEGGSFVLLGKHGAASRVCSPIPENTQRALAHIYPTGGTPKQNAERRRCRLCDPIPIHAPAFERHQLHPLRVCSVPGECTMRTITKLCSQLPLSTFCLATARAQPPHHCSKARIASPPNQSQTKPPRKGKRPVLTHR